MTLARVVGTVIPSRSSTGIQGAVWRILEFCDHYGKKLGSTVIGLDLIGSNDGDIVLLCQGSSVRWTPATADKAVDVLVVALVEIVDENGTISYRR